MSNKRNKQTNFVDKVLGTVQREGGSGAFIAIGQSESERLRSDGIKIYGDSGLSDNSITTYLVNDFIDKIDNEITKTRLEEEEKSEKMEQLLFATHVKSVLYNLGIQNLKIQESASDLVLSFDSKTQNKYEAFTQFFIRYSLDGTIIVDGLFKKIHSYKVSIRSYEGEVDTKENAGLVEKLNSLYIISANEESLIKNINQNTHISQKLITIAQNLEVIMINRKYFIVTFKDASNLLEILEILNGLFIEFVNQQTGLKAVTVIQCFKCGAKLDENDRECSKCGAQRPRCSICLLDLQPSEKEQVVQLPCCGVYGHRDHVLMWVEKAHTCPNCKSQQIEWLDELNRII